jgi:NAD+ synthase
MTRFSPQALALDPAATAARLGRGLRSAVLKRLRRRGVVVAVSGGVDSACVVALAAHALGNHRVHALILPERESSPESTALAARLCDALGVSRTTVDLTATLEAVGCYRERTEAVRSVFPGFEPGMRWKIVLGRDRLVTGRLSIFSAVIELPGGETRSFRVPADAYLRIVAATNFKQRTRKMLEYHHADLLHFAVAGTPNRVEYDQGFFVKLGDGAADVKPIAALYKTQVYALARHLGVLEEITEREPTTDTYTLSQSQEEFYFSIDHRRLDLLMWALDHRVSAADAAPVVGLTPDHVRNVYDDIVRKRRVAEYLHAAPIVLRADPRPREPGAPEEEVAPRLARTS